MVSLIYLVTTREIHAGISFFFQNKATNDMRNATPHDHILDTTTYLFVMVFESRGWAIHGIHISPEKSGFLKCCKVLLLTFFSWGPWAVLQYSLDRVLAQGLWSQSVYFKMHAYLFTHAQALTANSARVSLWVSLKNQFVRIYKVEGGVRMFESVAWHHENKRSSSLYPWLNW